MLNVAILLDVFYIIRVYVFMSFLPFNIVRISSQTIYILSRYYTARLNEGLEQHTEIAIWIQDNMGGSECIVTTLCFLCTFANHF